MIAFKWYLDAGKRGNEISAALRARLLGLALIAMGAGLAWFFGFRPLQEAAAGAKEVSYSLKLFVAAPLAIVAGLFLLVGGAAVGEAYSRPPRTRRDHLLVWPMFLIAMAAGGLAWWWFEARLDELGYVTGG